MEPLLWQSLSPRQIQAKIGLRIRRGEPGAKLLEELVASGISEAQGSVLVNQAINSARSAALVLVFIGMSGIVLGLTVTVVSYAGAASRSAGGEYIIWFGPVVVGIICAILGFARLSKYRW